MKKKLKDFKNFTFIKRKREVKILDKGDYCKSITTISDYFQHSLGNILRREHKLYKYASGKEQAYCNWFLGDESGSAPLAYWTHHYLKKGHADKNKKEQ